MFENVPVRIPEAPGKIVFRKNDSGTYELYETGRVYDPETKYNRPERKVIGMRIEERPEFMLPNDNYRQLFPERSEAEEAAREYARERDRRSAMRDYFDQIYFEFMALSKRNPEGKLNAYKAKRINQALKPMMELLRESPYANTLELLPENEGTPGKKEKGTDGMSYSDVAMLLTSYKCAVNRFFMKRY